MNKKINWRRQLTQLEKQTLTELKNKELIKQGTFYKLEQTFPEESAYTYYGLYRKEQTIQAYIVGYCFDGETLEATIVAPNVGPFFEELVQELEKQAALWGMKEVFLVMDDKQSVGLNYFNRQGIVPAFSEQYLVFQRETCSQALAKLTLLRPQVADLHSLARLLEGTPLPEDLQRTLIYKENNQLLATLRLDHFENEWGIYGFVVTKTQRGRGLGRQVLQSALRMILEKSASATIFLEVETENQAALHLYQTEGFQVRNQYNYYQIL